jgi:methionine biosynthesis protein MetW
VNRLERLSELYAEPNRRRGREFVWGGAERSEPLRRAVGGPGRRVLDLGCRDGALTRLFAPGNEVVGLDVDREALEHARRRGIETVRADVESPLPFADASFDVVVLAELLEHCREPQLVVDEAARVLRPGGTLAGSVPNAYRLKNRLRFLVGRPIEANSLHLHMFDPASVEALLTGFEWHELSFVAGRLVRLHPRLFANVIVFSARKGGVS